MNTPQQEIYQWLPADERLAKLLQSGCQVVMRNAKKKIVDKTIEQIFSAIERVVDVTDAKELADFLIDNGVEYLPPTVTEVLELPDCEGWWWTWSKLSVYGPRWLCFEYTNLKLSSKGHYVNASLYPKPNFNPVTGELLK